MNKIEIITQELTNSQYSELVKNQEYEGIRDMLNLKPLIDNPTPITQVPVKFGFLDLFTQIQPSEVFAVANIPGMLERIERTVNDGNIQGIQILFSLLSTLLSPESQQNIVKLLATTEPDPNYQSRIHGQSRSEDLNIYPVTEFDIQAALNPVAIEEVI